MSENGLSMTCNLGLCLHAEKKAHRIFVDFLKKFTCQWSGLRIWIFVALWVCVFVCVLQGPTRLEIP